MDIFIFSLTLSSAIAALILYGWKILNWLWFTPRKLENQLRRHGFHGNSYRVFYGDFKEMRLMSKEALSKPVNFSHDIVQRVMPIIPFALNKYGEKCFVWLGPRPAVVAMDPDIVREVLSKSFVFRKPSGQPFSRLMSRGLVTLETDKWAKHRRLINPAFHADKLKHMVPSFYLSCADMLSKWEEIVASDDGSCEVDVWPFLQTLTSDVISRTAFGSSFLEGRKIFQLQKELGEHVMEGYRSVYIPGYRFLPTKINRRIKYITNEVKSSLLDIINKRMKEMEAGEGSREDLLGLLLESNSKEIKQNGNKFGMSIDDVIEECKLFYFAGQETTASLLVWTMILLSKHMEWQIRGRDEVFRVFGTGKPHYQELNQLKIVNMILHEALRLYPPATLLTRVTDRECSFEKMSVPAGVQLLLPIMLLHHDPKLWGEDAEEFNPMRFSKGTSKLAYFPFGWGPRICIAQSFAMLEAKMAMAMILQKFSFELSLSYSHAPCKVVAIQPQHGAHLILTKL